MTILSEGGSDSDRHPPGPGPNVALVRRSGFGRGRRSSAGRLRRHRPEGRKRCAGSFTETRRRSWPRQRGPPRRLVLGRGGRRPAAAVRVRTSGRRATGRLARVVHSNTEMSLNEAGSRVLPAPPGSVEVAGNVAEERGCGQRRGARGRGLTEPVNDDRKYPSGRRQPPRRGFGVSPGGPQRSGGPAKRVDTANAAAFPAPSTWPHRADAASGARPIVRNSSARALFTSRRAARSLTAWAARSRSAKETPGLRKRSAPSMPRRRS